MDAINICDHFQLTGKVITCEPYGEGHINSTYMLVCDNGKRYILQKVNGHVFRNGKALMENVIAVTQYISTKISEERQCLHLIPTCDGILYYVDENGEYWRVYDFIEDAICLQAPETQNDFYESAMAFGAFQKQLADFPADTLAETIPAFHNTPNRYKNFLNAVKNDSRGRVSECRYEIDEYLKRAADANILQDLLTSGMLPLRVTHNDTKLNNVMLDMQTRKALCVIDLDTVMPGLMAYDFGDSIRFGAATAKEDEKDLSKMTIDLELFRTYTKGYMTACPDMTDAEVDSLRWGAKLMTLECGVRFLTDYLEGDVYFSIHYPQQNLDRARTQLKLVMEMEKNWEAMGTIVNEIRAEL